MSVKYMALFTCDNCEGTGSQDPTPGPCDRDPPKGWQLFLVPTGSTVSVRVYHLCPRCKAQLAAKVPLWGHILDGF